MSKKEQIATDWIKSLGLKQSDIARSISHRTGRNIGQPDISKALNGRNEKLLYEVINYLIDDHEIARSVFFNNEQDEELERKRQLFRIEDALSDIRQVMTEIYMILKRQEP